MLVTNQGHGWAAWRQRGGPWWKTLAAPAPALPPHLLDCINRAPPWSASAQTWPSPSPFFFSPCTPTAILSYLNLHGSTNPLLIPTQMTDASSFDDIFLGQMMGSTSSFCPFSWKEKQWRLGGVHRIPLCEVRTANGWELKNGWWLLSFLGLEMNLIARCRWPGWTCLLTLDALPCTYYRNLFLFICLMMVHSFLKTFANVHPNSSLWKYRFFEGKWYINSWTSLHDN